MTSVGEPPRRVKLVREDSKGCRQRKVKKLQAGRRPRKKR